MNAIDERESARTGEPTALEQGATLLMTRADIEAVFMLFLGRRPTPSDPVDAFIGRRAREVLSHFMAQPEFRHQPERAQIVLIAARKVIDARQADSALPAAATS